MRPADATPKRRGGSTAAAAPPVERADSRAGVREELDRVLAIVPRALSSHAHILLLFGLGVWLIVLPLVGIRVSSTVELIGGNYTNVTSDIAASIAAGLTVKIHHDRRSDRNRLEQLHASVERLHAHLSDGGAGRASGVPAAGPPEPEDARATGAPNPRRA